MPVVMKCDCSLFTIITSHAKWTAPSRAAGDCWKRLLPGVEAVGELREAWVHDPSGQGPCGREWALPCRASPVLPLRIDRDQGRTCRGLVDRKLPAVGR